MSLSSFDNEIIIIIITDIIMKTVKTVHWCRCKPPPEATLSLCHQDVRCRHHRHRPHLHQRNQQGRPPLTPRLMPWGNLGLLKCPSSKILQPTSKGSTGSTGSAAETDPIALMKTSKDCRCRSKTGYLVALVVIGSRNLLQPSISPPGSYLSWSPFLVIYHIRVGLLLEFQLTLSSTSASALPPWQDRVLLHLFSTSSTLSSL